MNLYKIWQDNNNDWDTWDSAVVVAETEEEARNIHPDGVRVEIHSTFGWCNRKDVKVELIGTAIAGLGKGVICASFNAG